MTIKKTDKQLREETRARRAKQDLKNTPLPLKRGRSSPTRYLLLFKKLIHVKFLILKLKAKS